MSIPLTASTEPFTPKCMAEIEGAPSFTFRHASELDRYEFGINCTAEGLKNHSTEAIRQTIISELRRLFEGDGLERNITRLEAYWQAGDDLAAAQAEHRKQVLDIRIAAEEAGETAELPPEPVLDFPAEEVPGIELMLAQVAEHSEILSLMAAQNLRYSVRYPRMLLRMFLVSTTLPVPIQRRGDLITPECCEKILAELDKAAKAHGVDPEVATSEVMVKAMLSFALTGDEEKNSSSPLSDTTSPEQSAKPKSSGKKEADVSASSDHATSEQAHGSDLSK